MTEMPLKPKISMVKVFVLAIVAVASILMVMMLISLIVFSIATSIGTEKDQIQGIKAASFWLLVASCIPLGRILYGLRGVWRAVSAVPFLLLICLGLLGMFQV